VFQKEAHGPLHTGEALHLGPYTLTLRGVTEGQKANATYTTAILDVNRGNKFVGTVHPSKALYTKAQQPMTEVALRTTPAEDLYMILGGVNEDGTTSIQAYINPLVSFVWVGGLVMVFGTLIALSDKMRLRREEKIA
jgi:cytochrome c-type biogenesis protein CcmF